MRLTKYAHSCLRVEHDGGVLVVDPGVFSEPAALDGADAVLITHEHPDHLDVAALTRAAGAAAVRRSTARPRWPAPSATRPRCCARSRRGVVHRRRGRRSARTAGGTRSSTRTSRWSTTSAT